MLKKTKFLNVLAGSVLSTVLLAGHEAAGAWRGRGSASITFDPEAAEARRQARLQEEDPTAAAALLAAREAEKLRLETERQAELLEKDQYTIAELRAQGRKCLSRPSAKV